MGRDSQRCYMTVCENGRCAYRVDHGQQETAQAGLGQDEQPGESQKLEDYEVILGDM